MSPLTWNDSLELRQPRMDATHREFIDLLAALADAVPVSGSRSIAALRALIEHTVDHFGQEERWMAALGFAAQNCHSMQHAQLLQVMREVLDRAGQVAEGDVHQLLQPLAEGLAQWFPIHAQMMDAALAMTMAERGFDPEAGTCSVPEVGGPANPAGCGSAACG